MMWGLEKEHGIARLQFYLAEDCTVNMHLFQNYFGFPLNYISFYVEILKMKLIMFFPRRYTDDMELDDVTHIATLTLKEGFEGQISEKDIEIGIIGANKKFRVLTTNPG